MGRDTDTGGTSENFMDAFGKLNINDFMRSYTNRAVHIEEPSEQEKNRLFTEMKKILTRNSTGTVNPVDIQAAPTWYVPSTMEST